MKKKTKITLAVLCSFLVGGGIGTAIGYGVWGTHEKTDTQNVSEEHPQVESSVKEARRFGLKTPVMKTAPAMNDFSTFLPTLKESTFANATYEGQFSSYSITLPKGSIAKNGMLVLRFWDNASTHDYSNFQPQGISSSNAKVNLSGMGIATYAYGSDDDDDFWSYTNTFTSTNAKAVLPGDGQYFYLVIDMNSVDNKEKILLGSKSWDQGHICIMHSSNYTYDDSMTNGATKEIYVDCDKNYSKETIISSISAKDLFGKDVPVTVTEGLDTFTPQTIGVYTLKLKATDSYGQTATATLIVHIVDYVAPSVTQAKQLTFTADKGQTLKYQDLSSYITVTDNGTSHGSSLTVTYTYDGTAMDTKWSKTFAAADYGSHNVKVVARDGSGNQTEKTFTLKVNDGTAPVITRRDGQAVNSRITIGVSKTFSTTLADILQMYQAIDNVDGDVSKSLAGVADADRNFFTNNHKVGNYTLNISAKDKDNNTSTLAIPITISADMPPVFLISDTLIYTDTATPLTTAAINKVISNGVLASKKIASLNVDASEYLGNEDKPGTYTVTYDYTEVVDDTKSARRFNANKSDVKSGSLDIVVKEASKADEDDDKEDNWFVKFFKSIGEFFEKLFNWFRGVFTKGKFDCFITNEEWNLRFPPEAENTSVPENALTSQGAE